MCYRVFCHLTQDTRVLADRDDLFETFKPQWNKSFGESKTDLQTHNGPVCLFYLFYFIIINWALGWCKCILLTQCKAKDGVPEGEAGSSQIKLNPKRTRKQLYKIQVLGNTVYKPALCCL